MDDMLSIEEFFYFEDLRYEISCDPGGDMEIVTIAKFSAKDVAELCLNTLKEKFPNTEFYLDDRRAGRNLRELLALTMEA